MDFIDYIQGTSTLGGDQPINSSFNWAFWTLMLVNLFALAWVRTMHRGYLAVLFRTGIYNRQLYQNIQEDLRINSAGSVFLTIAYFNCFAILASRFLQSAASSVIFFFLGTAILVVGLKYAAIKTLGFLTEVREGLAEHWINHLIYFQIIALVLTPVLCLTYFAPQSVQPVITNSIAIFLGLMVIYREIQSFMRAIRLRISPFYIILYLCTLELIPLIVLIKVLMR